MRRKLDAYALPAEYLVVSSVSSICNRYYYFGWFGDFLIDLTDLSRAEGPYMYKLPYPFAYAFAYLETLSSNLMQTMHILIQAAIFIPS